MRAPILVTLTATSAAVMLMACGGSDSSVATSTTTPAAASPATTIAGSAVKGPISGATVTVKNASTGAVLGTTTTVAGGSYSLSVPYVGDVVVEVTGGRYVDEATNVSTALAAPLKMVLNANGGNVTGIVTPLTTMAYTYAFPVSSTAVTAAAFNTQASSLASQFQLSATDLASVPVVTGTTNAYGKVLAGMSKYMQAEGVTLPALVNSTFTSAQWGTFSGTFSNAYKAANPGSNVTYTFTGNTATITGTGVGGGTGSCGVNVAGTITVSGFTVPLNLDYCFTGIAAGSCTSGNSTLSQALNGQQGLVGAANLAYQYSATCVANPAITLKLN